jgi:uncharacterized protein
MSGVFEFDNAKSAANKLKHGIDFVEAQALWADDNLVVVAARMCDGEVRWAALGMREGLNWTAFFTWRGDIIRLFSVRRSRQNEKELYYSSRARKEV